MRAIVMGFFISASLSQAAALDDARQLNAPVRAEPSTSKAPKSNDRAGAAPRRVIDTLKGSNRSTVLPNTARKDQARGGTFI
jgi:hypothetical protein